MSKALKRQFRRYSIKWPYQLTIFNWPTKNENGNGISPTRRFKMVKWACFGYDIYVGCKCKIEMFVNGGSPTIITIIPSLVTIINLLTHHQILSGESFFLCADCSTGKVKHNKNIINLLIVCMSHARAITRRIILRALVNVGVFFLLVK